MINQAIVLGRLTKDPQLIKTQPGVSLCKFTVAVNRRFSKNDEADFITCNAWRQSAEYLSQYGHKGDLVSVIGSIQTGSYDDQTTGKKIYTTDINVESLSLINTKSSSNGTAQDKSVNNDPSASAPMTYNDYATGEEKTLDINSDDLPF